LKIRAFTKVLYYVLFIFAVFLFNKLFKFVKILKGYFNYAPLIFKKPKKAFQAYILLLFA